jgi:hypothetical protein
VVRQLRVLLPQAARDEHSLTAAPRGTLRARPSRQLRQRGACMACAQAQRGACMACAQAQRPAQRAATARGAWPPPVADSRTCTPCIAPASTSRGLPPAASVAVAFSWRCSSSQSSLPAADSR